MMRAVSNKSRIGIYAAMSVLVVIGIVYVLSAETNKFIAVLGSAFLVYLISTIKKIIDVEYQGHTEKEQVLLKANDTVDSIVVAFVIAMLIRAVFIQAYVIPSGSMLNTLLIGDNLLVNKTAYWLSEPAVDDIIVFEFPLEPSKNFIKRVVAVPGDKVKITNKALFRNEKQIVEPFVQYKDNMIYSSLMGPRDNMEEFTVPEGHVFVMGDNRDASLDGRYWGLVNKDLIHGKAFIIYFSLETRNGLKVRFDRILKLIH